MVSSSNKPTAPDTCDHWLLHDDEESVRVAPTAMHRAFIAIFCPIFVLIMIGLAYWEQMPWLMAISGSIITTLLWWMIDYSERTSASAGEWIVFEKTSRTLRLPRLQLTFSAHQLVEIELIRQWIDHPDAISPGATLRLHFSDDAGNVQAVDVLISKYRREVQKVGNSLAAATGAKLTVRDGKLRKMR